MDDVPTQTTPWRATRRIADLATAAQVEDLLQAAAAPVGSWVELALCPQVDGDLFFPEKGGSVREAQKVCADCPVRAECLQYALDNGERFGVWGGMSDRERRALSDRRAAS
jgi:WhiB family redox-sensing transcriptional regulator